MPVRLIGDRGAIFETDPHTKNEFYWLANQGVPIRLRFNPTWFPEIDHWKMALFVGQNIVEFGSGNFAPTELAPVSSTNYDDETELFTDDPALVERVQDEVRRDVERHDARAARASSARRRTSRTGTTPARTSRPGNCADYAQPIPTRRR